MCSSPFLKGTCNRLDGAANRPCALATRTQQRRGHEARRPDAALEEVELPAAQRRVAVPFERRAAVVLSRLGLARWHKLPAGTRALPHPLEDKNRVLPQPVLRQRLGEVSHRLVQRRDLRLHN